MSGQVSSIGEIFAATGRLYKRRALPIFLVILMAGIVSLLVLAALGAGGLFALGVDMRQLPQQIFSGGAQEMLNHLQQVLTKANPLLLGGGSALLVLTAMLMMLWQGAAQLAVAVDENAGIMEALCTGWHYLCSLLWIDALYGGVIVFRMACVALVAGGLTAAVIANQQLFQPYVPNFQSPFSVGLTIVLPILAIMLLAALLAAVSLSMIFRRIVMLDEDHRGIDALIVSRLYMRGHWWNTLFKLLAGGIVYLLLYGIIYLAGFFLSFSSHSSHSLQQIDYVQLLCYVIILLLYPLPLLYLVAVYRDLKRAGGGKADPDSVCRCWWRFQAAVGILLPLLGIVGAAVTVGPKLPGRIEQLPQAIMEKFSQAEQGEGLSLPPPAEKKETAPAPKVGEPVPALPPPAVQQLPSVDGFLVWRDPTGDTGNPFLDIKEVSASGKQDELLLAVTLARPFAAYFADPNRGRFDPLISFYIDADMQEQTGAVPFGGEGRTGYDLSLEVLLAADADNPAPGAGRAFVTLYRLNGQERVSEGELDKGNVSIADATLNIRLPYSQLKAAAGSSIRMCFRELAQTQGDGLSKDQIIPLQ